MGDGFKRIYYDKNGNRWIQRKGHVFREVKKVYKDGELIEKVTWRAVMIVHKKSYWKQSQDKAVVEQWIKDMLFNFGKKEMIEYGKRPDPERVKSKYRPPVRVGADRE